MHASAIRQIHEVDLSIFILVTSYYKCNFLLHVQGRCHVDKAVGGHLSTIFLAAVLGVPPQESLASVPMVTGLQGTVFSSPQQQTLVSWMNGGPSTSPLQPPTWPQPCSSTPSQLGLMLSPAAPPFPQKLVDKVRAGHFVDMRELLADNVSLLGQLEAMQGMSAVHMLGPTRPRL